MGRVGEKKKETKVGCEKYFCSSSGGAALREFIY
jgi:hypothetical protein